MFKSVDELNQLCFDDCVISGIEKAEDGLVFEVEALIIKPNNSQNTNFTESYAGTTAIKISDAKITDLIKCGYKYYNADGKLIKEVPDEGVNGLEWDSLMKSFPGNYLPSFEKEGDMYSLEIEMADDEDGCQGYTYLLKIAGTTLTVTWEKYLNRVQR